jgi:hypothetical protein
MPSEILIPALFPAGLKILLVKLFPPIGVVAVELGKNHSLSIRMERSRKGGCHYGDYFLISFLKSTTRSHMI